MLCVYLLIFLTNKNSGVILNAGFATSCSALSGTKGFFFTGRAHEFRFFPDWVCGCWHAAAVGACQQGFQRLSHRGAASVLEELLDN